MKRYNILYVFCDNITRYGICSEELHHCSVGGWNRDETMGEVGERMAKRKRRKKLSPFTVFGVLIFCLVVCGLMIYKTALLHAQTVKYSVQIEELKKEQKKLKEEAAETKNYQSYVNSKDYIEEVAREKLGLVYPNEIIFEPEE